MVNLYHMANQAPRATGLLAGQCLRPFLHVVTHRRLTHIHKRTSIITHTHRDARQALAEKSRDDLGGEEQQRVAGAEAPVLVL